MNTESTNRQRLITAWTEERRAAKAAIQSNDLATAWTHLERAHILKVLELCEGQKTKAAQMLGINRTTLWKKLRQYGLEAD